MPMQIQAFGETHKQVCEYALAQMSKTTRSPTNDVEIMRFILSALRGTPDVVKLSGKEATTFVSWCDKYRRHNEEVQKCVQVKKL